MKAVFYMLLGAAMGSFANVAFLFFFGTKATPASELQSGLILLVISLMVLVAMSLRKFQDHNVEDKAGL